MTGEHLDEQSVVQINLVRQKINAMKTSKQPLHMWLEGTDVVGLAKASQICSGCAARHKLAETSSGHHRDSRVSGLLTRLHNAQGSPDC